MGAGLQEIETPELEKGSSGIKNQRTASRSQETEGHDRGTEDRDRNTGSHAQGTGGQGRGIEGRGQETGSQDLRIVNQDTGQGQGTNPAPETGITKNTRKRGHERDEDQHQDPGQG